VWYLAGAAELLEGRSEEAWRSWQRSLRCSEGRLPDILDGAAPRLSPEALMGAILPDSPRLLLAAAAHLHPDEEAVPARRPFLDKVIVRLERPRAVRSADDYYLRGQLYQSTGQVKKALTDYQDALARAPHQSGWRCELVELLLREGKATEARDELLALLENEPGHPRGRALLRQADAAVARQRADRP
jgi:predicted Zn-dependent protease